MGKKICIIAILLSAYGLSYADIEPIACWDFERQINGSTVESISRQTDRVTGNYKYVEGVRGKALRFDGFTTQVVRKADEAPKLGESFSFETWVAIGAYPWNWAPILSQADFGKRGFYFGIDSQGRFGLCIKAGDKWIECKSEIPKERKEKIGPKVGLDMRKWYQLTAVYEAGKGIRIYQNAREVNSVDFNQSIELARELALVMGRNRKKMEPTHPVRAFATHPSWYSLDGIIDEIKIYDRALTKYEILSVYNEHSPKKLAPGESILLSMPDIPERHFPTVPDTDRFGAYYTKLKYYEQWDALWRVSDYIDVVVQFDEHPIKVVYWRGSRYSPCWVSENGKWMADQSREEGGGGIEGAQGCCEHMSDAQCRHSRVRLIEDSDARVVVHWRYALIDTLYRQTGVDPLTGWGLWGDEIYTIYPDGVGIRNVLPGRGGWQETIFFNEPGTTPEDNVELEAITLVNLEGESKIYSWENGYPKLDLEKPVIQMTNFKSQYRPFMIFRTGSGMKTFNVEVRPEYSHFPWWNHWPVAQVASDGRHAQAADRAAHSSLVWGRPIGGAAIYGMTNKPAVSLVPLARSWNHPPELVVKKGGFTGGDYDYKQRAYLINCEKQGGLFQFKLAGSEASPIVNPALVIKGWGKADARLKVNGKKVNRGSTFRFGHRDNLDGIDLIVWLKYESTKPVQIELGASK